MNRTRRWYLWAGGLLLAALVLAAIFAGQITPVGPEYREAALSAVQKQAPFPPSARHWFGTDQLGRDVLTRVVFGTRWTLFFAGLVVSARLLIALPLSYAAARRPRTVGWLVGRLYVLTGSIPPLVIYLLLLAGPASRLLGLWPSVTVTAGLLTLVECPRLAVSLQGRLETLLTQPFMEGAAAVGATARQIYRDHLRPHLWPIVLQVAAQEVARVLLILGQLGIFGILAGGGVIAQLSASIGITSVVVSGIPEWGSMLADARKYMLVAPWMTFAPAVALFTGIVGANWLAQGLEGVAFPMARLQAATTGRISAWWRWVLVPVAAAGLLWYDQGLPWGQEQQVKDLVARQAAALQAGDMPGYLATLSPDMPDYRRDRERWAQSAAVPAFLVQKNVTVRVSGHAAMAWVWHRTPQPGQIVQPAMMDVLQFERRWGQWYEVGQRPTKLRGFHVDLEAVYDPYEFSSKGQSARILTSSMGTAADRAYDRLSALLPARSGADRPLLRLYQTHDQYLANVPPEAPADLWYVPGRGILISPESTKTWDRTQIETSMAQELLKALTPAGAPLSPLTLGLAARQADIRPTYRADFRAMAGTTLASLDELFSTTADGLTPERQHSLTAQAALLIEFLQQWLTPDQLVDLSRSGAGLAEVARAADVPATQLRTEWAEFLYNRVADESVLTVPAGKARVPLALTAEMADRAAGRPGYSVVILDVEDRKTDKRVYLLERMTEADGKVTAQVRSELWTPPYTPPAK